LIFTTSRYASAKLRQEAIVMAGKAKDGVLVPRGKKTIADLIELARKIGQNKIMVLKEGKNTGCSEIEISASGRWRWI